MQGFLLSIRVVTPILLMLCVGMLVRRLGWVDEKTLNVMDRLGFKLLLPIQLFYSLYRAEWDVSVYGKPLLASIVIILIILVLACSFSVGWSPIPSAAARSSSARFV